MEMSSVVFGDVNELNAAEYTSAGELVVFELSPNGTTIIATAGSYELMTFVLTTAADGVSGTITATINGQFDHPDPTGVDQITLTGLNLVVTDGDDDTTIAEFPIVFDDSTPEVGTPEEGIFDKASMDGFYVIPDSGENYVNPLDSGSLDISWNADNTNNNIPDATADRSVVFDQSVLPQGLTSNREIIQYEFSTDGTSLRAFVGNPQFDNDQSQRLIDESEYDDTIFEITLDDSGEGHYTFKLYNNIDHYDEAGNPLYELDLNFGFIATDADGDQAQGSFVVSVIETLQDSGVAVSEEGLKNSNPDNTPDSQPPADTTNSAEGSGEIKFSNSGFTPNNISASWSESSLPGDITSKGEQVEWFIFGNELFGYVNQGGQLAPVITITLGSVATGQNAGQSIVPYDVELHRPIDHSDVHQEDVARLQFGVTVSDGSSSINGTIKVNVEDDSPVCEESIDIDEMTGVFGGSFGADGPGEFTFNRDQDTSQTFLQDGVTPVVFTTSADGSRITGTYEDGGETKQAFVLEITDAKEGTYQFIQQVELDRNVLPIKYVITDKDGDSTNCDVEISISNSFLPDAVDNSYNVNEGASVSGNIILDDDNGPADGGVDSDVDGGPLQVIEIDGNPVTFVAGVASVNVAHGNLEINQNGTFTYTHDGSEPGQDPESFTYTISDGNGGTDTATVYLAVEAGNDDPVAVNNRYDVSEGLSVSGNIILDDNNGPADGGVDSDVDGGPLQVIEIDGNPVTFVTGVASVNVARGTLEINQNGTFTYTHDGSEPGQDPESFTYTISDGNGGTDTATVYLAVEAGNDDPVAVNNRYDVSEGLSVSGNIILDDDNGPADGGVDSDVDGGPLQVIEIDGNPVTFVAGVASVNVARGTLEINQNGTFTYTHDGSEPGQDPESFTYTISDGNGGTDTATVYLAVEAGNDDPVAVNNRYDVSEGLSVSGNIILDDDNGPADGGVDSDVDGGPLQVIEIDGNPVTFVAGVASVNVAHGNLEINQNGTFTYTHDGSEPGLEPESFTYTISDGNGGTDTATVYLTVEAGNDDPVSQSFTQFDSNNDGAETIQFVGADNGQGGTIDYISDSEGQDMNIRLLSLPEHGKLIWNSPDGPRVVTEDMLQSGNPPNFAKDSLSYEADPTAPRGAIIGDTGSLQETEFANWGINGANQTVGEIQIAAGQSIKLDAIGGTFDISTPITDSDRGGGLGIDSTDDEDADIDTKSEKIKVTFVGVAARNVTITLDGLKGYFDWSDGAKQLERVELVVYGRDSDGNIINQPLTVGADGKLQVTVDGSGNLHRGDNGDQILISNNESSPTNLSRVVEINTLDPNVTIDHIEIGIEGRDERDGSFEVRNIQLNTNVSDSFDYVAVDTEGAESNVSTVTIDTSGYHFSPLVGTSSDETLTSVGGENNAMSGMGGSDTFIWTNNSVVSNIVQHDVVTDFSLSANVSAEKDTLDLEELLGSLITDNASDSVKAGELAAILNIFIDSDNTILEFNDINAAAPNDLSIILQDLNQQSWNSAGYNVTVDLNTGKVTNDADVLEALISNGQLIV